jgi:hypothetical protein
MLYPLSYGGSVSPQYPTPGDVHQESGPRSHQRLQAFWFRGLMCLDCYASCVVRILPS